MTAVRRFEFGSPLSVLLGEGIRLPCDPLISAISLDSRLVSSGALFLALRGNRVDGSAFIDAAIKQGAAAVVWEAPADNGVAIRHGVPVVAMAALRWRAGEIAARFYGEPSRALRVVGITGTNGKTSCSHFLAQALGKERPVGVIGTLGSGLFGELEESGHTTPDAVSLQAKLALLRDRGVHDVVMEVSSHGLDQGRVHGVRFDTALFTNLSRDHLDYHPDMAHYGRAKRRLFTLPGLRNAVINADDPFGRELLQSLPAGLQVWGYTLEGRRETSLMVSGEELQLDSAGLRMRVHTPVGGGWIESPVVGRFNATNLLAVLASLLMLGLPLEDAIGRLAHLEPVSGRMERFGGGEAPMVVVDYAHTPDALAQVLSALQGHGERLWCVFGCGGDRDRGKRPLMGRVAARYADRVIVTDDNPRTEDPAAIVADILRGIPAAARVSVCHQRASAIEQAILQADERDVVLIAGKGHERYQLVGGKKLPFSDREVVQKVLAERGGRNE